MSRKNKTSGIDDLAKSLVANHGIDGAIAIVNNTPRTNDDRFQMWNAVYRKLINMREIQRGF